MKVVRDVFGNTRYYNKANQLHRLDGPAVVCKYGYEAWFRNGKRHRDDGPALVYVNGYKVWYRDGIAYETEEEWEDARCPSIEEAAAMFKEIQS